MFCNRNNTISISIVETEANGSPLPQSRSCVRCSPGTRPSADRRTCVPCPVANCTCPLATHELLLDGTLCVSRSNLTAWPDGRDAHLVEYDSVGAEVESKYLKKHLRPLLYKCVKVRPSRDLTLCRITCYIFVY